MTAPQFSGLYGVPPGADFPQALVDGLDARMKGAAPEDLARVTVYLNSARMMRRVRKIYDEGPARLLPRLHLVTQLGRSGAGVETVSPLRRKLELMQMVRQLIAAQPDLAPESSAFDLASGIAALMDEMQGEDVSFDAIAGLDVTDNSGHWARSRAFLDLVGRFVGAAPAASDDPEAVQRRAANALIAAWSDTPPRHPIIIAGSTGSRGTTRLLMQAVAKLPGCAVVLPGVDTHLPDSVWSGLTSSRPQQDHPQFRIADLIQSLDLTPSRVPIWAGEAPAPARNRLVSMALRPAPVTDAWLRDGPSLGDLRSATQGLTLLEAPDQRAEANAIALRLRRAVEDGEVAALVTPDRMLTRRVAAALDRWRITPDDSAGEPLRQTAVGRFLRHIAGLFGDPLTAESLLVVLKHPLAHAAEGRRTHILLARELEISLRRFGPTFPTRDTLANWANAHSNPEAAAWAAWVSDCLMGLEDRSPAPLLNRAKQLIDTAERLNLGSAPDLAAPSLWSGADGELARSELAELVHQAEYGGDTDPFEFDALLSSLLGGEVRNPITPNAGVMIWGTLESRVQGADLVILGGLNDGVWPEQPAPDPWLNRSMREQAGLLLPERRIGLSAHDFQQAVAAPEVVLSRALRNAEAQTVPSRWVNRLCNLLEGLKDQHGDEALQAMRDRGAQWVSQAEALDRPSRGRTPPALRPSPRPPLAARPRKMSVTDVETLIRDPYAIYAKRILKLSPLDTLRKQPEARLRGTVLHAALEAYVPLFANLPEADRVRVLSETAEAELDRLVPWPAARRLWLARLSRAARWFVRTETERQTRAAPVAFERTGTLSLPAIDFTLSAKADRIDMTPDGSFCLYDYKTGNPPTPKQQKEFAKQLLLEVAIAERAGFTAGPNNAPPLLPAQVECAEYIGLGANPKAVPARLVESSVADTLDEFTALISHFDDVSNGYTAQMARFSKDDFGDYDHLSRAGEWDMSLPAVPEDVGT